MEPYRLDLTITAAEGAIHDLGTLVCMAWITAATYNPLHRDRGRAVVTTRRDGQLTVKDLRVDAGALGEVVGLIRRLDLPQRKPQVKARDGNINGWQEIVLTITLDGQQSRVAFEMQYAGLEGEDAALCSLMLVRLFDLLGVSDLGRWG